MRGRWVSKPGPIRHGSVAKPERLRKGGGDSRKEFGMTIDDEERLKRAVDAETMRILEARARATRRWWPRRTRRVRSAADIEAGARAVRKRVAKLVEENARIVVG